MFNLVSRLMPLLMVATLAGTAATAADVPLTAGAKGPVHGDKNPHVCTVQCTDPHACCAESQKVLDIVQKLSSAYAAGDVTAYEEYLDDQCVVIDGNAHKVISGKANVLAALNHYFTEHKPDGDSPLVSFHIDQPFAKVSDKGDSCTVTFVAMKEVGGSHPHSERANVTDIFVKRDSGWKKLHWQGKWEPVTDKK